MRLGLLSVFIIFVFLSCKKKETQVNPNCDQNKTGTISVYNRSAGPYDIYINQVYKVRLTGKTTSEKFVVPEGKGIALLAQQVNTSVIGSRIDASENVDLEKCSHYTWTIP